MNDLLLRPLGQKKTVLKTNKKLKDGRETCFSRLTFCPVSEGSTSPFLPSTSGVGDTWYWTPYGPLEGFGVKRDHFSLP